MKAQCVWTPTVEGEKSKLYSDINNKCLNNRPLTNLLYGIATSESFIDKYCSKKTDLDRLGQPRISIVDKVMNIQEILDTRDRILQYEKDLDAYEELPNKTNPLGKKKQYSSPNALIDKVQMFNKNHDDTVASIVFDKGKYYIKIEPKDANNYLKSEEYRKMQEKYSLMQDTLKDMGFDTDYDAALKDYVNFYNVDTLLAFLRPPYIETYKYKMNGKFYSMPKIRDIFNDGIVEWLLHLDRNNLNQHMKNFLSNKDFYINGKLTTLGCKLIRQIPLILKKVVENKNSDNSESNTNYIGLTEEEKKKIAAVVKDYEAVGMSAEKRYEKGEEIVSNMVIPFLMNLNTKLAKHKTQLNQLLADTRTVNNSTKVEGKTYGADTSEIKEIMEDLNKRFHLNYKEVSDNISNVKDAVEYMLLKKRKEYSKLRSLKSKRTQKAYINRIERDIEEGKYAESILRMLKDIDNKFHFLLEEAKDMEENTENETNDELEILRIINKKCAILNKINDFIYSNKDILLKLKDAKNLKTEGVIVNNTTLEEIEKVAGIIFDNINQIQQSNTENLFNTVYDALRIYWGEEDIKEINGVRYSLKQMLTVSMGDITAFDRWLNSPGKTSDPIMNLIYKMILDTKRRANEEYSKYSAILNEVTEKLYASGSDSKFMFQFDENGVPTGFLKNPIDWDTYYKEYNEYKKSIPENTNPIDREKLLYKWKRENNKNTSLFSDDPDFKNIFEKIIKEVYGEDPIEKIDYKDITFLLPNSKYWDPSFVENMTAAQKEYYYTTLAIKAILSRNMPMANFDIFRAIQIQGTTLDQIQNAQGVRHYIKNRVEDIFSIKEDDTEYMPDDLDDALEANDVLRVRSDAEAHLQKTIPILYSRRLKDKTRLSTNMSQALNAWMAAAVNYNNINDVSDIALAMQEVLTNIRKTGAMSGKKSLLDIFKYKGELFVTSVVEKGGNIRTNDLLKDFYEKVLYERKKNPTQSVNIFGVEVSLGKVADFASRYTSITGLSTNLFGAEANLLVGKLQMAIEAGAGEFFNFKDFAVAETKYYRMLPELMNELNSNNKKSILALLGNFFDVQDDFLEKAKEKGFEKEALKRILSNPNLMFLYGLGEHPLHYTTMLAVLNHVKVRNKKTGVESTLLDIFSVKLLESGKNGILEINNEDYELQIKDENGEISYRDLTKKDINNVRAQIKTCNNTMHGAFGEIDKGACHRIAFMRLVMNFRQWMPAHYARRFQGEFYDADTDTWRKGYYVSTFNFLKGIFTDKDLRFKIRANWEQLSDTDKYNVKRACTELTILAMLTAEIASLGTYKDKKGNWAYRNLQYILRRLRMETLASVPIGPSFVKNIIAILNSPMASISAFEKAFTLFNFTNLFKEVEGGKHRGENMYLHKLERNIPLLDKINSQLLTFAEEDYLFNTFDMGGSILALFE